MSKVTGIEMEENASSPMEDSFSIFAELLISKIFDYYLRIIYPDQEDSVSEEKYNSIKNKYDSINTLISILEKNGIEYLKKNSIKYIKTKHQVFLIAGCNRKPNEDEPETSKFEYEYMKVDDRANIDVGIFFNINKDDKTLKILVPFEVKTGFNLPNNITDQPSQQNPSNNENFKIIKGSIPGILAHKKIKMIDKSETTYSLFGLMEKPEGAQRTGDCFSKYLENGKYAISSESETAGFIRRENQKLKDNPHGKFSEISLEKLFSEFAEQFFIDNFVEEEEVFAEALKYFSKNIEVCWEEKTLFCLDEIKNKNMKKKEIINKFSKYRLLFFTLDRKISVPYIEFSQVKIIKTLKVPKGNRSEDELIEAQGKWDDNIENMLDIQKLFNGIFDLRKKRIEAEFNNYVHRFLNTIETDFYNEWIQK